MLELYIIIPDEGRVILTSGYQYTVSYCNKLEDEGITCELHKFGGANNIIPRGVWKKKKEKK